MVQNFCGQRIIQHTNDKFLFSRVECKQTLDQLAWLCTLHHAGQSSNPLGVDLLTRGGVVYLHVEKNPLVYPMPNHRSKSRPVSRKLRYHCVWVGQRFGGFIDLREKIFFLSIMPEGCLTPRVSSFFFKSRIYNN
jgi:hypothetical protein